MIKDIKPLEHSSTISRTAKHKLNTNLHWECSSNESSPCHLYDVTTIKKLDRSQARYRLCLHHNLSTTTWVETTVIIELHQLRMSQCSSGNMPQCGTGNLRIKFHHEQMCAYIAITTMTYSFTHTYCSAHINSVTTNLWQMVKWPSDFVLPNYLPSAYLSVQCVFSEDPPAELYLHDNDIHTLSSKKSDAKIQITITMAHLIRINYHLSSFNYRLSGTKVANFNKIRYIV